MITRGYAVRCCRSLLTRAVVRATPAPLRLYTTGTKEIKSLKVESFAFPKEPLVQEQHSEVPHEDINDFRMTRLVHGTTDAEIAITERAAQKLSEISTEDKNPNTALKISVESGGCHGFQYNLNLTDLKSELAAGSDELLVFKREDGTGRVAQVVLDPSSLDILQDSKIDYTTELIGSSFKVVDSPYTSSACGCGSSFDFDFEKLQKKLESKGPK